MWSDLACLLLPAHVHAPDFELLTCAWFVLVPIIPQGDGPHTQPRPHAPRVRPRPAAAHEPQRQPRPRDAPARVRTGGRRAWAVPPLLCGRLSSLCIRHQFCQQAGRTPRGSSAQLRQQRQVPCSPVPEGSRLKARRTGPAGRTTWLGSTRDGRRPATALGRCWLPCVPASGAAPSLW